MARTLTPPYAVSVTLPANVYRTHGADLRSALRGALDGFTTARLVTVKRGDFDIEIGLNAAVSMDFLGDVAFWQHAVEDVLADAGLNPETGEVD